jgi:ABC-2 type transport system permease protein
MFRRIWTLIIKEFLAVLKDKKSRTVLILPPLMQLFVFSWAATLDVKNVSIGIFNNDSGKLSFELIQRFKGSPTFTHIYYLEKEQDIRPFIDNQKGSAVLHFDEQFSRDLLAGKPASMQMILDGRKSNSTQIILGYANRIVDQFNKDLAVERNLPTSSTVLIPRNWFNSNLIYTWFTVPGLVATLAMLTSLLVTAMTVAREKELGTFEQLLVSPLLPIDILIGKTVPGIIIGMGQATLMILAAVFIFNVPLTGSLWLLYGSLFFFIISVVGVGLFLSSLSKTQQQALLYVFMFVAPAVILSGFATPVENMPVWLQKVTVINPLKHFLIICRGVFLKEMTFDMVLSHVYPIVLIAAFNLVAATWFFRKRIE